jgi:hypothetical protein
MSLAKDLERKVHVLQRMPHGNDFKAGRLQITVW